MPEILPASSKPVGGFPPLAFFKKRPLFLLIILLLILAGIAVGELSGRLSLLPKPTSIASLPPIRSPQDLARRLEIIKPHIANPATTEIYQQYLKEAIAGDPNLPLDAQDVYRAGKYAALFAGLRGEWYGRGNREVLYLAQQVRDHIKQTYPVYYQDSGDDRWKIVGE